MAKQMSTCEMVSIPSQAGTLFGPEYLRTRPSADQESQYPLRRAPSSDQ